MPELSVRLLLSGALVFVAGWLGPGSHAFTFAAGLAAVHAAWAGLANRLEARGLVGPRVAAGFGAADAGLLAALLIGLGPLGQWQVTLAGGVALGPALAIRRLGAPRLIALAAPVALAGAALAAGEIGRTLPALGACALASLAVLMSSPLPSPLSQSAIQSPEAETQEDEVLLELRLAFRKLREAYRELEASTRRERLLAGLGDATLVGTGSPFERVAERLRKLCGASGLVIYTVAGYDDLFTVRAAVGDLPPSQSLQPLEVSAKLAPGAIREQADVLLDSLRGETPGTNVPLMHEGRVVGVVAASLARPDEKAHAILDQAAPWVAALVADQSRRETVERRLKETELLYGLATATDGASGRADMAARAVRDLKEMLGADAVSIALVEDGVLVPLASEGLRAPILEAMSFGAGGGVGGWVAVGAPEIVMPDVRGDARCASQEALRARIGSFVAIPMNILGELGAVLCAATSRVGGLDVGHIETLRAAAAEIGRRFGQPLTKGADGDGLLLPTEFATRLLRGGALVTLDPMRLDHHEAVFGRPALAHALRTLGHRVKARLPEGAAACRTPEGRLLVWLPEASESQAIAWANETAAVASMIGLRTPDGTRRIPIAVRAKAALLEAQGVGERMAA